MATLARINWSRDETLIALDFYLRHKGKIQKGGEAVRRLSRQLRALATANGVALTPKHRNAPGVYMKLMNLRAADPALSVKGLAHGAGIEEQAWKEFGARPAALSRYVEGLLRDLPRQPSLLAVEGKGALRKAHKDWERAFAEDSDHFGYMDGVVWWAEDQRFWANFLKEAASDGTSFMTFLGVSDTRFRANRLVEINLPYRGNNRNIQGALALDDDGNRWVLHQGRLHTPVHRVSSEDFAQISGLGAQVEVAFENGDLRPYFKVANIDAPPAVMRAQVGDFLRLCERVRIHYTQGSIPAQILSEVEHKERGLFPETSGTFARPAQAAGTGERSHGLVFKALVEALRARGLNVANERIGRYGPDLYTACQVPKLFEIKTSPDPADVQQGVGQLFLYEQVLGAAHTKILVLPKRPSETLEICLSGLGVRLLEYQRSGRKVWFEDDTLVRAITD